MEKILYLGGVASNAYQINTVAQILSDHYGVNVIGLSFTDAQKDQALVARLASESLVITHSAGLMMLQHATPLEVIAIAPPMPTSVVPLITRNVSKTIALMKSRQKMQERRQKIRAYNLHALQEHIAHPFYNVGQLAKVSAFNAAKEAVIMSANGSKVTLCFMNNELIFVKSAEHHYVETAKEHGVIVHDQVPGHHDEFLLYPLDVLAAINRL